ncbi:MAG: hypothetical protein WAW39_28885 [Prosthecobacter sp.]|uniref:hypothetical protein n=1 Tax=Prosthecobacter sp. TaxID=1965333 RepID=UPI003BB01947
MDDLHVNPPFIATSTANLVGGPLDGSNNYLVPIHCHQFDLEDGTAPTIPEALTLDID